MPCMVLSVREKGFCWMRIRTKTTDAGTETIYRYRHSRAVVRHAVRTGVGIRDQGGRYCPWNNTDDHVLVEWEQQLRRP